MRHNAEVENVQNQIVRCVVKTRNQLSIFISPVTPVSNVRMYYVASISAVKTISRFWKKRENSKIRIRMALCNGLSSMDR